MTGPNKHEHDECHMKADTEISARCGLFSATVRIVAWMTSWMQRRENSKSLNQDTPNRELRQQRPMLCCLMLTGQKEALEEATKTTANSQLALHSAPVRGNNSPHQQGAVCKGLKMLTEGKKRKS